MYSLEGGPAQTLYFISTETYDKDHVFTVHVLNQERSLFESYEIPQKTMMNNLLDFLEKRKLLQEKASRDTWFKGERKKDSNLNFPYPQLILDAAHKPVMVFTKTQEAEKLQSEVHTLIFYDLQTNRTIAEVRGVSRLLMTVRQQELELMSCSLEHMQIEEDSTVELFVFDNFTAQLDLPKARD